MKKYFYLVLVLVLVCSFVQAESAEEKIQQLEAKIQQLKSRLDVLQDETREYTEDIVREYLQSPAIEDDRIAITAGYDKGFFVRDTEGTVELKISGYLQNGLEVYENNTEQNNGFFTKNARINFEAFFMKDWHARLEVNYANNPKIVHAYIEYLPMEELKVLVGTTVIPFSMQAVYNGWQGMTILFNPFVSSWGHISDLGVIVSGVIGNVFGYSAGLFNGVGSFAENDDDELLVAGQARLYYCGYKENSNNFIHVGVLADRADGVQGIDNAQLYGFERKTLKKGEETDDWKLAIDFAFKYVAYLEGGHSLRFEAEAMAVRWDRAGVRGNIIGYGATAGIQYRHCFTPDIKDSGLMLGANFCYNDIDNHGGPAMGVTYPETEALTAYIYTLMLGYAFNSHIDVAVNWIIMDLDQKDGAKDSHHNTGSLEQAWLLQITAKF